MSGAYRTFELNIAVQPDEIDELGHVNNIVYLRWVQDVAIAHWRTVAPAPEQQSLLWVVVRHEIDYKQPALPNDQIIARTWVGDARRVRFERHTEILRAHDRTLLAKAITFWCPIDVQTGKLTIASPEVKSLFV